MIGQLGEPHTSGHVCSPQAPWLTGEVIDLSGDAHLKRYPDVLGPVMKLAEA
jgi:hypothetical protein